MEINQAYGFAQSEKHWQEFWERENIYTFDPKSLKPIYSIDTPPPTISGNIHIGHIFSYTQAEVIARFKRMMGYNVFYPFGFDDNGLPTERLVEKEIGKKWGDMERKEFVSICLQVTKKYREIFKNLWKSIGISADWNLEYSTISPLAQRISQRSFLELLEAGKIKRLNTPALWCTECRTSVAQAELENKNFDSIFYEIAFVLENGQELIIATTRPELLPACVAVFVHPEDVRYIDFIGKKITTPLGDTVTILADEKVDRVKWTGVVMCCTYGDETDMYWQKTHSLREKIIMDSTGTMVGTGVNTIDGQYYKKARKTLVEILRNKGNIRKETSIEHSVNTHERCGTPIEILPVKQWFIEILPVKQQLLDNAEKIRWYPEYMKKRYIDWVENLKWDWCISRQRFYGVPTPVWYSKITGELILPDLRDLPMDPVTDRPKKLPPDHTFDDIEPDYNILDTWATSSLSPEINARTGESDSREDKILPMDLRPQAHDIIRTWAFYTIARSQLQRGVIPFKDIMISGHVLAKGSEKISKSKNNAGKSPEELIEQYSADAVRYWSCGSSLGKDTVLDEQEILKGRKLVNKLWNVMGFLKITLADYDKKVPSKPSEFVPTDIFILTKLHETWEKMEKCLEKYEFSWSLTVFEEFFWHDFCDNYLEIIKDRMYFPEKYENGNDKKLSGSYTLYTAFLGILKLIAPILPHITEAIFQDFYKPSEEQQSIHQALYTSGNPLSSSPLIQSGGKLFFEIIDLMRKEKSKKGLRLGESIECIEVCATDSDISHLQVFSDDIRSVSKAAKVVFLKAEKLGVSINETFTEKNSRL